MINSFRKWFGIGPRVQFGNSGRLPKRRSVWDELDDLQPGQVLIVTHRDTGAQYATMHVDDFDHIAGMCNLIRRDLSETVSDQP